MQTEKHRYIIMVSFIESSKRTKLICGLEVRIMKSSLKSVVLKVTFVLVGREPERGFWVLIMVVCTLIIYQALCL